MFGLFKKKAPEANDLKSPVSGKVIPITEVQDDVFSSCMLGKGVAIQPAEGVVVAPANGEISVIMEGSNHAVGLKLANGLDLLIHVGLDTVSLNGEGFQCHVSMGDKVSAGQKLLTFDSAFIKSKGLSDEVMLIVLEGEQVPATIEYKSGMDAVAGETVVATW